MKFLIVLNSILLIHGRDLPLNGIRQARDMQETVPDGGVCNTMIPPSPLAPDDSSCWEWYTPPVDGVLPAGAPKPPTGCDYKPCESAVCGCDSYCCDTAWDLSCRGYYMRSGDTIENNYFVAGCSAKLLCCEQESAFPDPPIGAAMAGAMPANSVQVVGPAFAGDVTAFQCEPGSPGCCDTMIPPSFLPPDDSTCWQWWDPPADGVMNTGDSEPPKGCDYTACEQAVCACDSYCCDAAWDLSCRGYHLHSGDTVDNNFFVDQCSAKLLCCEPESAFPDPPVGGASAPVDINTIIVEKDTVIIEPMQPPEEPAVINVPVLSPGAAPSKVVFVPVPQVTPPKVVFVPVSAAVVIPVPQVTPPKVVFVPVSAAVVIPVPQVTPPKVIYVASPNVPVSAATSVDIVINAAATSNKVTKTNNIKCKCPDPQLSSAATATTYITTTATNSKSKSGSKSGKSGKSGKRRRRLSSNSAKGTIQTVTRTNAVGAATATGYFSLSEDCTCPCVCSAPQTTYETITQNSGATSKSKAGKGKSGSRRLSSKKCGKSKGNSSSSGCAETSTINTVTTSSAYNNACICDNVAASSVTYNTITTTSGKSGKSKAGKRRN